MKTVRCCWKLWGKTHFLSTNLDISAITAQFKARILTLNQKPAGVRTASTSSQEKKKIYISEIFSFHYSVIEDRSRQSVSMCRTKSWQMKGKQTRVLHVTHAVKIKMNLLLFSADRPSIMSGDTGQDNEDQTACCESPSQNTHRVRNTP